MRILHISDPHLPAPSGSISFLDLRYPKRLLGWANLRFRRASKFRDAPILVARLAEFARELALDAVVCTGDFVTLGTDAELAACRRAIQPLVAVAPRFLCVPGNHDVYVSRGPFVRHFGDICPGVGDRAAWPRVVVVDGVTLIMLDVARPMGWSPLSNGRLPDVQARVLRELLAGTEGFRLVVMHHGLLRPDGRPDFPTHGLVNRRAFEEVLRRQPRAAVLHGHIHTGYRIDREGAPPLFCAGSATQTGRAGGWLFDIDRAGLRARRVEVRDGQWRTV